MVIEIPTSSDDRSSGQSGFIILERTGLPYYWEGRGLLSIKSFRGSPAYYNVGSGCHAVDESSYLVLNHDQRYSITIEPERSVESFCVFFEPGLVSGVLRSLSASASALLDEPDASGDAPEFFERTYRHDALLSPALFGLRDALPERAGDRGWLRERAHDLVERLLELRRDARAEAARLAPVRAATRHELYRRLHRGRDFIEAMYRSPITVDDAARAACLSASHFLRTFKDVFGLTPNAYLMRVRLDHARRLLEHTDMQVVEICECVGYASPGTFTRTFARAFGVVPSEFRRSKKMISDN